jgi:hypothetical protein
MARPMPRLPPVTTATLPFKLERFQEYIASGIVSLRDTGKHLDASSGVGHN